MPSNRVRWRNGPGCGLLWLARNTWSVSRVLLMGTGVATLKRIPALLGGVELCIAELVVNDVKR